MNINIPCLQCTKCLDLEESTGVGLLVWARARTSKAGGIRIQKHT